MSDLFNAVGLFGVSLLLHVVLVRILVRANRLLLFIGCGCVVIIGWVLYSLLSGQAITDLALLRDILLFGCICELYVLTMMFSLASISGSIVHRLHGEPMTAAQVEAAYSSEEMVRERIDRMINTGYYVEQDGRLRLADKAHRSVSIFDSVRAFFGHEY